MNSSKKIDISQSSLLGLKAELLRKKEEVENSKATGNQTFVRSVQRSKLKTKFDRENEGLFKRNIKDAEQIQAEADEVKKSQSVLKAKAELYDKIVSGKKIGVGVDTSNFLVDFKTKTNMPLSDESDNESILDDSDSEWVEFTDCLGRSRKCLKEDLESMKKQDEKLSMNLNGEKKNDESVSEAPQEDKVPDLCSEDMKKEFMRQKWEEQEKELSTKKNIHYQDVLFNEARSHGVGYYQFSTEEETRLKQQEDLRKLQKDTMEQQSNVRTAAELKKKQMDERLRAARRRKRERLGLPPNEESEAEEEPEPEPEKVEELQREERKPGPERQWDIGKSDPDRVLTQEEWIKKKRDERPQEFAPPSYPESRGSTSFPAKRRRHHYRDDDSGESSSGWSRARRQEPEASPEPEPLRRGAEIPPPPSLDCKPVSRKMDIEDAIEQGLSFLRKQFDERQAQKNKGLLDIV